MNFLIFICTLITTYVAKIRLQYPFCQVFLLHIEKINNRVRYATVLYFFIVVLFRQTIS